MIGPGGRRPHCRARTDGRTDGRTGSREILPGLPRFPFRMCGPVALRIFSLLFLAQVAYPMTLHVPDGSTLALDCLLGFSKQLDGKHHSWSRKPLSGGDQTPSHLPDFSSQTDQRLLLKEIQADQEGTYECVTEGVADNQKLKLRAEYIIYVVGHLDLEQVEVLEAVVGEDVQLPCAAPRNNMVGWRRKTDREKEVFQELTERGEGGEASFLSKPPGKSATMVLNKVKMEDSGTYLCYWDGNGKEQQQKVELRVREPPPPRCAAKQDTALWEHCEDTPSGSGRGILQESLNEFAAELYSLLSQSKSSENLLFSPISIAWALTHILLGAQGSTHISLETALRLPHQTPCLHEEMRKMREVLLDTAEVASQIYHSPELQLNEVFINQSEKFYGVLPEKLGNSSEQNVRMINDWVARKTNQKIRNLVDYLPQQTQLVLLSTVYFIGKWQVQFSQAKKESHFVMASGDMVSVPVLYSPKYKMTLFYSAELEAEVAAFSLSGQARLFVLLPEGVSSSDLQKMESKMTVKVIKGIVKMATEELPQLVEVTLPKIKLDINTDLMDLLEKIGLKELFETPNLCGLSSEDVDPPLVLGEAVHRSFLSLTETGVEAGAATAFSYSRNFLSFSALRPFSFLLWSDKAECPLFLGRVMKP
ncbi:plasma protease C1 inhibitor isoform X2 [Brienomyrus brachyistius]|nr:plasma protease C1 inhibitor isoform X2 [Brienomyrus brachyistius]